MVEVLVWLLIVTHTSYKGSTTVIEKYKTQQQCEHVVNALGGSTSNINRKCIQANILVAK